MQSNRKSLWETCDVLLDLPLEHTQKWANCKQKVFCYEMIHSALAINYFSQDDWLLGIVTYCIDSQWKVPNSSYFSIISCYYCSSFVVQGFVVGFKTLDAGCGRQKPSPWERECSASLQFPKVVVIFFFPLVAWGLFCCLSAQDHSAQHKESILDYPIPVWLGFFSCCCLCCLGYQVVSAVASPFFCFSKFCYYPLL